MFRLLQFIRPNVGPILILILSLGSSLLTWLVFDANDIQGPISFIGSAAVGAYIFLLTKEVSTTAQSKADRGTLKSIEKSLDGLQRFDSRLQYLNTLLDTLSRKDPKTRHIGMTAIDVALRGFDAPLPDRVEFAGHTVAIETYHEFWRELAKPDRNDGTLAVLITHASDIGILSGSSSFLREEQSAFHSHGNAILRIFIDIGDGSRVRDYLETMDALKTVGVVCCYILASDLEPDLATQLQAQDFCIVTVEKSTMYWQLENGRVKKFGFSTDAAIYAKRRDRWRDLADEAVKVRYENFDAATLAELKAHQRRFKTAFRKLTLL